jgi:hypothetical protein
MNFIDFVQFVKTQCMYETIYEDSNDNLILVTRMLDAYAMANKMVAAERERIKAANAPEIERVNAHIKELERDAARYREVREWDFCGYDHGLTSPESVDRAVDNARGQA